MSETASCRNSLSGYCLGCGLDIGHGGDLIVPWAIGLDRGGEFMNRAHVGNDPTHLTHDATNLPFKDETLDFVFSSHCLEDFQDTYSVMKEWIRVLKYGGYLVLFLPDQVRYVEHCKKNGAIPNQSHKHPNFGASYIKECVNKALFLDDLSWEISHLADPVDYNPYSFEMVVKKL